MRALRSIAVQDNLMSFQLDDHQVVDQVAALVARRALCLLGSVVVRPFRPVGGRAAPQPTEMAPVAPGPLRSIRSQRTSDRELSELETVHHAQQAAVLVEAARDGVPFCEMCEKARQEGKPLAPAMERGS